MRALDGFLAHLPMAYDPDLDRLAGWRRARLAWVQHAANVWPVFGRSRGTGRPGLSFFNRGGEPLAFDPLNKLDRLKNAHGLLVGPTGAGKSATLGAMLAQLMAVHRPRLFVIEAGNSFGLLADWFESLGLSVNRVALKPGSGVSLPTFADAALLPEAGEVTRDTETPEDAELPALGDVADDDEDEPRDILGELETVATLMVTGGEAKEVERLRRSDRRVIRDAVIESAKNARAEGVAPRTEHVRTAFHLLAETREGLLDSARQRLRDMGDALGLFCDGFAGEVFNRDGDIWPETDVTLVDLAHFAREGYEAHLAIALISLLNVVNHIAERDQRSGREIVVAIDEAHIVTTHPLVSPYLVKIVKMWRKLGAWLWLATQNLEDFPGAARKLLNMIEWWVCLVMPTEEVDEMRRFRDLTEAQRALLLSATKAHGQYTEGVVLAGTVETLFRCVPPSLILALVQTERHEKARRAELMAGDDLTEVEAARFGSRPRSTPREGSGDEGGARVGARARGVAGRRRRRSGGVHALVDAVAHGGWRPGPRPRRAGRPRRGVRGGLARRSGARALAEAMRRLETPAGRATLARLASAAAGNALASRLGIEKLPAVVVDGRYVVYGVRDVARAVERVQAWRLANETAIGHGRGASTLHSPPSRPRVRSRRAEAAR